MMAALHSKQKMLSRLVLDCELDYTARNVDSKLETWGFFEETIRHGPGRRPAKINTQLSVALAKNPVGAFTFTEILSTCEVITPAEENLRKLINIATDKLVDINKDQLAVNKKIVKNKIISTYSKNTT